MTEEPKCRGGGVSVMEKFFTGKYLPEMLLFIEFAEVLLGCV